MVIMHVQVDVKLEYIDQFKEAIVNNATQSRLEPGNLRFDVAQSVDDPTKFLLIEVYVDEAARQAHWNSDHFKAYREVASVAVASRVSKTYTAVDWKV
jgi:(4S)-4-hydroxy-5-phosphonooxypentane-2,3-dione isomerase